MNFNKLVVLSLFAVLVTFAFATSSVAQDISTKQWRVFNINPDAPKLWDINKAQSLDPSGVGFNFNLLSSGWFTVYLNTNYGELTGKSAISANTSWTPSTQYINRSLTPLDAYFRLYFQSAQGNYDANDYWWSSDSCNLNDPGAAVFCNLNVSLTDRTHWTNLCGQSATDHTVYSGPDCVGGTYPGVSPYDGFTKAKRNVKDVGLSFGRAARYASGVAISDAAAPASFQLQSYTVLP
ncbi:MAG: hypothetical protein DMF73_12365 [Acidobacteria bacterium]|nr:MAG: hypothetical protein DMF73_12365 [Acidobacteriota bacterium]